MQLSLHLVSKPTCVELLAVSLMHSTALAIRQDIFTSAKEDRDQNVLHMSNYIFLDTNSTTCNYLSVLNRLSKQESNTKKYMRLNKKLTSLFLCTMKKQQLTPLGTT
jgi:hypothetical protein